MRVTESPLSLDLTLRLKTASLSPESPFSRLRWDPPFPGFQLAVPVLDALVGKGLLVPVSMFNRMCRSIFTRREGNWNSGWLRAKVLVGGEGSAGLPGAGAERGSTKRGRRDIVYSTEEPAEVTAGGCLGLELPTLLRGFGLSLFRRSVISQPPEMLRSQGWGFQGESLWEVKNQRSFSWQEDSKTQVGDWGPGQGSLCGMWRGPGVREGHLRWGRGGGVCETRSGARPRPAHPHQSPWLPGVSLGLERGLRPVFSVSPKVALATVIHWALLLGQ